MKPTPLLSDEPQTARLMLKEFTSAVATVRESEARRGITGDCGGFEELSNSRGARQPSSVIAVAPWTLSQQSGRSAERGDRAGG